MTNRSVRVTLSADVSGFQASLGKAQNSVETLSTSVKKNGAEWKTISTSLLGFGATAASIAVLAAKKFADFDEQMSAVKATGAEARDRISELGDAAVKAGAEFGQFDARDAAVGLEEMLKAGVSVDNILRGGLRGSLALAAAGTMSVGDAAEMTAMTLAQFNLGGEKASHVADLLAAGAGKAVGEVTDIGEALGNSGTVANQFGISVEETVGVLAMFAQNALVGANAGTALKSMLLRLASPTKEAQTAMDGIGFSAYDAAGNFVGLESMAGQLREGMKDLTQEQKNSTLETIFGTYAIQAATILYKEGAAGVKFWTDEVNDSGFAMEMAATKTDNLKGDIAEMSGAFETAMIQIGESSNNGLRLAVGWITELLEVVGRNSDTATIIVGIAAAIGGLAITSGIVMKGAQAFLELRNAVHALNTTMRAASMAAGVVGGVILVATAAIAHFGMKSAESKNRVESFTQAMEGQTSAINEGTRAIAAHELQESGAISTANKYGLSLEDLGEAALGNAEAFGRIDAQMQTHRENLEAQLSGMTKYEQDQSSAGRAIRKELSQMSDEYERLREAVGRTATDFDTAKVAAADKAKIVGESEPIIKAAATAEQQLASALMGTNTELKTEAELTSAANQAMMEKANTELAATNSAVGYAQALGNANKAAEESVKLGLSGAAVLDVNTEAGQRNTLALTGLVGAHEKNFDAMLKAGRGTDELRQATADARAEFIRVAIQMGVDAAEAENLANKYGLIPAEVITGIDAPGGTEAKLKADAFREALEKLPLEVHPRVIAAFNRGGIDEAYREMNAINGRVANTFINTVRTTVIRERYEYGGSGAAGAGFVAVAASGGYIMGPGTATSDSIPAWLSNGEFVQRAAAVDYYGRDFMARLNTMQIPKDNLPRFAQGGPVEGARWSTFDRSPRMTYRPVPAQNTVAGQASRNINIANLSVQLDGIESVQDIVRFGDMLEANAVRASAGRVHG